MKFLLVFLCLFVDSVSANQGDFVDYFKHFSKVFSASSATTHDYRSVVSYNADPQFFINFDAKYPMWDYVVENDVDEFLADNLGVIFNGDTSRELFVLYIKNSVLNGRSISKGGREKFTENKIEFTFGVEDVHDDEVVLFENILAPVGDEDDNYSERSCSYHFKKSKDDEVKLSDIICAG